jgi:hypothetical protein
MKEKDISMKRLVIKREARRKVVITNPENIVIISIRKEATRREVIIMRTVVSTKNNYKNLLYVACKQLKRIPKQPIY